MYLPSFIARINTRKITVEELRQGKVKKPVILLDVRSPEEYDRDRIANSQLVPLAEIQTQSGANLVRMIAQTNTIFYRTQPTIILYCTVHTRSTRAYKLLKKTGLNLVVLTGGIKAWRQEIPAEQDAQVLSTGLTQLRYIWWMVGDAKR